MRWNALEFGHAGVRWNSGLRWNALEFGHALECAGIRACAGMRWNSGMRRNALEFGHALECAGIQACAGMRWNTILEQTHSIQNWKPRNRHSMQEVHVNVGYRGHAKVASEGRKAVNGKGFWEGGVRPTRSRDEKSLARI